MRVMILQAGFNELGVIDALHKEGHEVIAIGNQPGLIGQQYVEEYICQDYSNQNEVLALAREKQIDCICACCNDTAVLTSVYVAEKMKLTKYDSVESAKIIANKKMFKKFAMENGVLTVPAHSFDCVEKAKGYVSGDISYPIIIKPVDLSGGKGVRRCDCIQEALEAIETAFTLSRTKNIVIEPFIEGTQHGFCTFLRNRKVVACCSNDELSVVNPYRVEMDLFPAKNIEKYQEILISQVELIAEKLQLVDGIFHLQYIESCGHIYIIEVMRRIIGNMYSVPASKANDFDWDYWEAKALIGLECNGVPRRKETKGFFAYRAIIPPRDGILKEIKIDASIESYIFHKIILEKPGTVIENYKASTIGIVFMQFKSREEMQKMMIEQYDKIQAVMEDL